MHPQPHPNRDWNENGHHHQARKDRPAVKPTSWWLCPAADFYRAAHVRAVERAKADQGVYLRGDLE